MATINPANIMATVQNIGNSQNLSQDDALQVTDQLMQIFSTLLSQQEDEEEESKLSPAMAYLMNSGVFTIHPPEFIEVSSGDDSGYWAALGYTA